METLHVLGMAGSLRKNSYNRFLLRAALELAPEGMKFTTFDLAPVPLYNAEMDGEVKPKPVMALKNAIREADALLFVTPEYNHGIPGVLKNAIDWASRPAGRSPLAGKPAAIMGASQGLWGTVRAQIQLRQVLAATNTHVVLKPEILVAKAQNKFDAEGRLTDKGTREFVRELLEALGDWTLRLRGKEPSFTVGEDGE